MLQRYFRVQSATLQVEWLSPLSVSVQHLETTYQSLAPPLHTTPWSVNEIPSTTVVDAEPGTENQTHKLNSNFFGPFVCASQLWIHSFSKQTMQITELFLKPLDTEFRFNESSSLWGSDKKKIVSTLFSIACCSVNTMTREKLVSVSSWPPGENSCTKIEKKSMCNRKWQFLSAAILDSITATATWP